MEVGRQPPTAAHGGLRPTRGTAALTWRRDTVTQKCSHRGPLLPLPQRPLPPSPARLQASPGSQRGFCRYKLTTALSWLQLFRGPRCLCSKSSFFRGLPRPLHPLLPPPVQPHFLLLRKSRPFQPQDFGLCSPLAPCPSVGPSQCHLTVGLSWATHLPAPTQCSGPEVGR